jgi:hypothetical protein
MGGALTKYREIQATSRALIQSAKLAIRDIFDAITELVTNSDDRYQILSKKGTIEIEIERRRGKIPSTLRVRDYADGMDADTMERKLSFIGGRDSGMAEGEKVRGTHSRGAKDVAALGRVVFESIAQDGKYHKCEITPYLEFIPYDSQELNSEIRRTIGIPEGTGTLVTIELVTKEPVPQHDNLKNQIERLVSLRGILCDSNRKVILRDLIQKKVDILSMPYIDGKERIKEPFEIPGYQGVQAKLIICRAKKRFERDPDRFRLGGIAIQSKRAFHQSTLFDPGLESDIHAHWFYGRLVCPYIDDLCNEFDDCFEAHRPYPENNPTYLVDPSRRSGLNRDHPFTKSLFAEALKRLRPLVEEERTREEHEKTQIESESTRRRLRALEKAALEFMRDYEEEETARDLESEKPDSQFRERGYTLSPPFTQMLVGHSQLFCINIKQSIFPEVEVGTNVQIECLTPDIISDKRYCSLEPHPVREGILRASWKVKAESVTPATGLRVRVSSIVAESAIEIFNSEADKYRDVLKLQFSRAHYRMRSDQKHKKIRLLAPINMVRVPTPVQIEIDSKYFKLAGQQILSPDERLQVAYCDLSLRCDKDEASAKLSARMGNDRAEAKITIVPPLGADLSIKLEDIDLVNQRSRWRQNVLEIATRHPSLRRYLGEKQDGYPGQDSKHFRLLVAEIVADAVCFRIVERRVQASIQANTGEFEDADWNTYYSLYSKYMTQFLPLAHKLQCPEE